ncbi:OLC1v1033584C1 [Oldenlandia corymbosa var. corymbosa]|uniref:OLC1v1033584C1 n=1 Tax=Oldenlandia corymbosa var. corymbosa TaxID=529605 RepID=A0AAV1CR80_OLDCO|nr:OLC1v1033584C1 [Oldenlandia corymbosa var. corymbosa]
MMASSGGGNLNTTTSYSNYSFQNQFNMAPPPNNNNHQENKGFSSSSSPPSFSWELHHQILNNNNNNNNNMDKPKFKSFSPAPISPSSYLTFPPSLSPSVLLDSPVLFSNSNALLSPTTGNFSSSLEQKDDQNHQGRKFSDFSFQSSMFHSSSAGKNNLPEEISTKQQDGWNLPNKALSSAAGTTATATTAADQIPTSQGNNMQSGNHQNHVNPTHHYNQPYVREHNRKSDDGYNWRKYGQKQVKGSENPRSYYKCTFPNCPTKKKVERNLEGHITEIVYKGNHSHPKPQSTRRSSSSQLSLQGVGYNNGTSDISNHSNTLGEASLMDNSFPAGENSTASFGDDDFDQNSALSNSRDDDENEPDSKRWKGENDEAISVSGSKTVREPRIVVQTTSEIDILDDGYRWRKYGQKVVKGNPNPRSYYKCTFAGCPVRKHVERASQDLRAVITTYEGKHNHDVPAARGSAGYAVNRPSSVSNNNMSNGSNDQFSTATIRPLATSSMNSNAIQNHNNIPRPPQSQAQAAPFTLQMLPNQGSFGNISGNPSSRSSTYMNQMQQQITNNGYHMTKEEPKDHSFFNSFLN